MQSIYSDIIAFRGTHFDFGYKQGELLQNSYTVQNREQQWKIRRPRFAIDIAEARKAITDIAPKIWEELTGFQQALSWPMEKVLLEFGGYRVENVKSGCSIFTTENYLIRNYDYHPKTYEGRFVLFQPSDGGYAVIGPSQRVTGRMDGMNEKGLVLGYNFTHRKKPGSGFICSMIGRLVLETCANVNEAVALLKKIPHRHSFSYIVLDTSGETYVIEATPRDVRVRKSHLCTNHFEEMQEENRRVLQDSYERLEAMKQQESFIETAYDAYRMLNDKGKGVFSTSYQNWAGTIHTAAYFPKEQTVWFGLGDEKNPAIFDFKAWTEGEKLSKEKITGVVETGLPFAHMTETITKV